MPKTTSTEIALERADRYGPMRLMAVAEGYVMAKRPRGTPFVVAIDEWNKINDESRVSITGTII